LPELTSDSTNGNHLLEHWIKLYPQYDYYYQYHVTSPLTNSTTISECVKILINKTEYDSILTVEEVYSWFWYGNCPINYDPKKLPRSQDATPVIKETTALYGISKIAFKETNCRIGRNPYFYVVDQKQAVDIDNPLDLVVVKALASEK
jgi:CMP-N,N'-diacetyllegionaminic acid synthase